MKQQWLIRYSEIFLKSDPVRRLWENTLIANVREVMPGVHVRNERGRIWLDGAVKPNLLKNIFGIVSFSE
ncbi:MAG: tRNA 4-thiouridine(8) synthase ThiI, partial [Methanoregula sp.]|nr:tRNA 4-thiouridine(8) synthase ThiI [Methanoregula sp.]